MENTLIHLCYPRDRGAVSLRGTSPLSWEHSLDPTRIVSDEDGDHSYFELEVPFGQLLEFKAMRDDRLWSCGRAYTVLGGEELVVWPYFEQSQGTLRKPSALSSPQLGCKMHYRLFLPPSYREHSNKRYPVIYAQDGQALFAQAPDAGDPNSWCMDSTLDQLYDFGVMEEVIVVAVTTKKDRLHMLSPTVDDEYGGGGGQQYLQFLVETLKPQVDATWRTRPGRETTAVIGSSMGGLFSFFAAWSRSDVFGRAACLSPSFWWDERKMVSLAQLSCPIPRPWIYLDSGASLSEFEEDANARDGFEHTHAMCKSLVTHCFELGTNLVSLVYPGSQHDASAWSSRLALPLQLLFPRKG